MRRELGDRLAKELAAHIAQVLVVCQDRRGKQLNEKERDLSRVHKYAEGAAGRSGRGNLVDHAYMALRVLEGH